MNKDRKERLLDVTSYLEDAVDEINDIIDEETEAFDALPESLQDSSRGEAMQDAIEYMEKLADRIDGVSASIESFVRTNNKPQKQSNVVRIIPSLLKND